MKQFAAFIHKEFLHIFRDRRTLLILLGMPIAMIVLFGFAISTEVQNIRVVVFEPVRDRTTQNIVDRFGANPYFDVVGEIVSAHEIDELFRRNEAELVIVFEENFEETLIGTGQAAIQLIVDGTDPNTASTMGNYAQNILLDEQTSLNRTLAIPLTIVPEVKLLYNPQMKSAYNFVPGVMGMILMLICAMMTSISIVREKERGTMEVLLVSPIRPIFIIIAKAVPYFVLSVVNLITILLLSFFVLDVPIDGSLFWLFILSFIFVFVALAIGLLISSLVKTQVAAMLASGMGLMMPVMVLSGMIFPVENMPDVLQWVSAAIPARWYIEAVKKIMIEGLPAAFAAKEFLILSAMAVVLIFVSLKKFNYRLE